MGSEWHLCPEEINQKINQIVGVTLKRGRSDKALRPKSPHHLDSALKFTVHIKPLLQLQGYFKHSSRFCHRSKAHNLQIIYNPL